MLRFSDEEESVNCTCAELTSRPFKAPNSALFTWLQGRNQSGLNCLRIEGSGDVYRIPSGDNASSSSFCALVRYSICPNAKPSMTRLGTIFVQSPRDQPILLIASVSIANNWRHEALGKLTANTMKMETRANAVTAKKITVTIKGDIRDESQRLSRSTKIVLSFSTKFAPRARNHRAWKCQKWQPRIVLP